VSTASTTRGDDGTTTPSPVSASTTPASVAAATSTSAAVVSGPAVRSSGGDDPIGDRTASADPAPAWSDLAGAHLDRGQSSLTIRVRLAGGAAPASAPSTDHSMNIAVFFDVDGDGAVEHELWLNLADDGWYPGVFRPASEGRNEFGSRSGVTTSVDGDEVVAIVPSSALPVSGRFRWSVASEWGRQEVLGTGLAARDDVPDDDGSFTSE
jgi:hypothetical protein